MSEYISEDIEISSNFDRENSDEDSEEKYDEENINEENVFSVCILCLSSDFPLRKSLDKHKKRTYKIVFCAFFH